MMFLEVFVMGVYRYLLHTQRKKKSAISYSLCVCAKAVTLVALFYFFFKGRDI